MEAILLDRGGALGATLSPPVLHKLVVELCRIVMTRSSDLEVSCLEIIPDHLPARVELVCLNQIADPFLISRLLCVHVLDVRHLEVGLPHVSFPHGHVARLLHHVLNRDRVADHLPSCRDIVYFLVAHLEVAIPDIVSQLLQPFIFSHLPLSEAIIHVSIHSLGSLPIQGHELLLMVAKRKVRRGDLSFVVVCRVLYNCRTSPALSPSVEIDLIFIAQIEVSLLEVDCLRFGVSSLGPA